jgi:signal transduction histidine kinase
LLLPSFAKSGWLPMVFLSEGILGADLLRPQQLFGLTGLDETTHCLFWSLVANIGCYVGISLASKPSASEHSQATLFVDALKQPSAAGSRFWRGSASITELSDLLQRFLGRERARQALADYATARGVADPRELAPDASLVHHVESLLAGTIGSASARVMVASVVDEEPLKLEEVLEIIDEATQALAYSRALEQKSSELEAVTASLRSANERLQELDRLKDDFVSTIAHELRTPLTSIRAFSEILHDSPTLAEAERQRYLAIVIRETERLTRLINRVLDLSKLESGNIDWRPAEVDMRDVIEEAVASTAQLFKERGVSLEARLPATCPPVIADRDRVVQVLLNLLSNAAKFCEPQHGRVTVSLAPRADCMECAVEDNGIGISQADQKVIFEKFRQVGDAMVAKPQGTGLGLPISRSIVQHLGGKLWVRSAPGAGARFAFTIPLVRTQEPAAHTA